MISGKVLSLDIGHRYMHIAEGKTSKKQIDILSMHCRYTREFNQGWRDY